MPRLSIQHFRATLATAAPGGTLARAYRELSRRPELASAPRIVDWSPWPPAA